MAAFDMGSGPMVRSITIYFFIGFEFPVFTLLSGGGQHLTSVGTDGLSIGGVEGTISRFIVGIANCSYDLVSNMTSDFFTGVHMAKKQLRNKAKNENTTQKNIKCSICGFGLENQEEFCKHVKRQHSTAVVCPVKWCLHASHNMDEANKHMLKAFHKEVKAVPPTVLSTLLNGSLATKKT